MSDFLSSIAHMIISASLVYLGVLSLETNVTNFWLWAIIAYSPWLIIPIVIGMFAVIYRMNYTNDIIDFLEEDSAKQNFKDALYQYKAYGLFYRTSYLYLLITGCLFIASSYIALPYGIIFVIYGISGIMTVQSFERFNIDKGQSIWK